VKLFLFFFGFTFLGQSADNPSVVSVFKKYQSTCEGTATQLMSRVFNIAEQSADHPRYYEKSLESQIYTVLIPYWEPHKVSNKEPVPMRGLANDCWLKLQEYEKNKKDTQTLEAWFQCVQSKVYVRFKPWQSEVAKAVLNCEKKRKKSN
jgi:hypothetical protein